MATVLAQVRSDAVRAGVFANPRRLDGIGFAESASTIARLAQRRDVINIDAEFEHISEAAAERPVEPREFSGADA